MSAYVPISDSLDGRENNNSEEEPFYRSAYHLPPLPHACPSFFVCLRCFTLSSSSSNLWLCKSVPFRAFPVRISWRSSRSMVRNGGGEEICCGLDGFLLGLTQERTPLPYDTTVLCRKICPIIFLPLKYSTTASPILNSAVCFNSFCIVSKLSPHNGSWCILPSPSPTQGCFLTNL